MFELVLPNHMALQNQRTLKPEYYHYCKIPVMKQELEL
jgi:hypothetical protein